MSSVYTMGSPDEWPSHFAEIKEIDSSLRCPICYEYVETAMMAPVCSHIYCSLCIKRYIGYKTQCPVCLKGVSEPELVNNRTLDVLIKNFISVRSKLLKALTSDVSACDRKAFTPTSDVAISNKKSVNDTVGISQPENHKEVKTFPASISRPSSQKDARVVLHRVQSPSQSSQEPTKTIPQKSGLHGILKFCEKSPRFHNDLTKEETPTAKGTQRKRSLRDRKEVNYRISSDTETGSSSKGSNEYDVVCIDSDDDNDTESSRCLQNGTVDKNASRSLEASYFQKSTKEEANKRNNATPCDTHTEMPSTSGASATEKVACPVCSVVLSQRHINIHLDRCLNPERTRGSGIPKRKPMAKLVYHLMSDRELKKRVAEAGLPTQGDRKMLEWRHREFTLLYNASCDSLHPKPVSELVKALEKSEKIKMSETKKDKKLTVIKGATDEEVALAQQSYVKLHRVHFSKLIEEARKSMKKKAKGGSVSTGESETIIEEKKIEKQTDSADESDNGQSDEVVHSKPASVDKENSVMTEAGINVADSGIVAQEVNEGYVDNQSSLKSSTSPVKLKETPSETPTETTLNEENFLPKTGNHAEVLCTPVSMTESEMNDFGRFSQVARTQNSEQLDSSDQSELGLLDFPISPILSRESPSRKEKKRKPDFEMSATLRQEEESPAKRRKTVATKQNGLHRNTNSSVIGNQKPATSQSTPQGEEDNKQQPKTEKRTRQDESNSIFEQLDKGNEIDITGLVEKDIENVGYQKVDSTVVIPKLVGYDISSTEESDEVPSESTGTEPSTDEKTSTTWEDKSAKCGTQPKGEKETKSSGSIKPDKPNGSQGTRSLRISSKKTAVQNTGSVEVKPQTRRTRRTRRSEEEKCLPEDHNKTDGITSDGTKRATRRSLRTRKS